MSKKVTDELFSGAGPVYLAELDETTGLPKGFVHLGDTPTLKISFATEVEQIYEHQSGQTLLSAEIPRKKTADATLTVQNVSKENLALGLYGTASAVTGSTVTAELQNGWLGKSLSLAHPKVTLVVVKGTGAKSAITYEVNKNYSVDADYGTVYIMSAAEQTAASAAASIADGDGLTIAYTYGAYDKIAAFSHNGKKYAVLMEGINSATTSGKFRMHLHKFMPKPFKDWSLIEEKAGTIELTGAVMADLSRAAGDQFATMIKM